jgi:hypothetical protein
MGVHDDSLLIPRVDAWLARREAPLTVAELRPVVGGSALAKLVRGTSGAIGRALRTSRTAALVASATATTRAMDRASRIACAASAVAVAAIVHIVLLARQPYQFPSRAAYLLPIATFAGAVIVLAGRRMLAAAMEDRRPW